MLLCKEIIHVMPIVFLATHNFDIHIYRCQIIDSKYLRIFATKIQSIFTVRACIYHVMNQIYYVLRLIR